MPPGATKCPRHWPYRFGVITLRLDSGERLPILIDRNTGIPPVLPLRWVLKGRHRKASSTWAAYLRRIAELYEWYSRQGVDFDELIMSGEPLDLGTVGFALEDVDRGLAPEIAGHIRPQRSGFEPAPIRNARMYNRRLYVWVAFVKWALRRENWQSGRRRAPTPEERAARIDFQELLDEFIDDERQPEGTGNQRLGLTDRELSAIEAVIAPDPAGRFRDDVFSAETLPRLWAMYLLARWGGLRIGEILNMHVEDVPTVESGSNRLAVRRRPDDEDDPRLILPAVKRRDRLVPVPFDVIKHLQRYIAHRRGNSRWPDLLLSTTEDLPLSSSRASDQARQLRGYSAAEYELMYPGESHTLGQFTWHRLRHTRALELLPVLVNLDDPQRAGLQEFLDVFGWARESSADPYILELTRERSATFVERGFALDREMHSAGADENEHDR